MLIHRRNLSTNHLVNHYHFHRNSLFLSQLCDRAGSLEGFLPRYPQVNQNLVHPIAQRHSRYFVVQQCNQVDNQIENQLDSRVASLVFNQNVFQVAYLVANHYVALLPSLPSSQRVDQRDK